MTTMSRINQALLILAIALALLGCGYLLASCLANYDHTRQFKAKWADATAQQLPGLKGVWAQQQINTLALDYSGCIPFSFQALSATVQRDCERAALLTMVRRKMQRERTLTPQLMEQLEAELALLHRTGYPIPEQLQTPRLGLVDLEQAWNQVSRR